MIKLGEMIKCNYGSTTEMWLIKNSALRKYTANIYCVMGFIKGSGWYTLFNSSLKNCRHFMEKYAKREEKANDQEKMD